MYIQNLPAARNLMSLVLIFVWVKFCPPSSTLMLIHCMWKRVSCNPVDVNATLENVHNARHTLYNNGQACRVANMLQSWVYLVTNKVSKRKAFLFPRLFRVASAQQLLFLLVWHCRRYLGFWVKGRDFKAMCIDHINEHRSVMTLSDVMVNYTRTGFSLSSLHPIPVDWFLLFPVTASTNLYLYAHILIQNMWRPGSWVLCSYPFFSVDVGEETPRTVCSGLVGSVPQEDLQVW